MKVLMLTVETYFNQTKLLNHIHPTDIFENMETLRAYLKDNGFSDLMCNDLEYSYENGYPYILEHSKTKNESWYMIEEKEVL